MIYSFFSECSLVCSSCRRLLQLFSHQFPGLGNLKDFIQQLFCGFPVREEYDLLDK